MFSTAELKNPLNNNAKYFKQTPNNIHFLVDVIGSAAAKAVQESIYDACRKADTIQFEGAYKGIIPSVKDSV